MNVLRISYCRTVQAKQYEPVKIEIDASLDNGQSLEDGMAQLRAAVDAEIATSVAEITGAKPPLAKADKPAAKPKVEKKPDPTAKQSKAAAPSPGIAASSTSDAAPWEEPAEKKPAAKSTKGNKAEAAKKLAYALESESLEELLERFNDLRKDAKLFDLVAWEAANTDLANVYRKLNNNLADPEIVKSITAAFRAEREYITNAANTN